MVSFTSIVTAAIAATGAIAAPATDLAARSSGDLVARQSTPSSTGTHNGCYYSWVRTHVNGNINTF
jgi:endo-1,4-beta-xylanase